MRFSIIKALEVKIERREKKPNQTWLRGIIVGKEMEVGHAMT